MSQTVGRNLTDFTLTPQQTSPGSLPSTTTTPEVELNEASPLVGVLVLALLAFLTVGALLIRRRGSRGESRAS